MINIKASLVTLTSGLVIGTAQAGWVQVATEGSQFVISGTQVVRYGAQTSWTQKTFTNSGMCTNAQFGIDPLRYVVKRCEVLVPDETPGLGRLPTPSVINAGSSVPLIAPTTDRGTPARDGVGAFRTVCNVSHYAFNDPIVYPNQPGRSHLHMFFGNTGVNAYSTTTSIPTTGNGTCAGGTLNRSAYWIPAMVDTTTGDVVQPMNDVVFYYKAGYRGVPGASIKAIPKNLRMIAGDAMSSIPGYAGVYAWVCHDNYPQNGPQIQNCAVGDSLELRVFFPQCWDGVNLDSPDHKSHLRYADGGCPSSHPVALPELSLNVKWPITRINQAMTWRLASDTHTGPAGYSAHADFWAGWDAPTMQTFVTHCINAAQDCHAYLLGDGRTLQ